MAKSQKITNNMFIWGNNTSMGSDLKTLIISDAGFVTGVKGGDLVKADEVNSGLRGGSLLSYMLIEALSYGPEDSTWDGNLQNYTDSWDTSLANNIEFEYNMPNSQEDTFRVNLKAVLDQYLKYSKSYKAIMANVWTNSRVFKISDNSGENVEPNGLSINGSITNYIGNAYTLKLPSTIKATLVGNASSADQIKTAKVESSNNEYFLTFVDNNNDSNTNESLKTNSKIKIIPTAGSIAATTFIGNLTGNVTGNLTGNADTATQIKTQKNDNTSGFLTFVDSNNTSATAENLMTATGLTYDSTNTKLSILSSSGSFEFGPWDTSGKKSVIKNTISSGDVYLKSEVFTGENSSISLAMGASQYRQDVGNIPYLRATNSTGTGNHFVKMGFSLVLDDNERYNLGENTNRFQYIYSKYFEGLASHATNDVDGNAIKTTYWKKSDLTFSYDSNTGVLTIIANS